jgi:crotonobetainyl-CoA:carnitine CoA-transferase CaiB-like acyl-CoA transferase
VAPCDLYRTKDDDWVLLQVAGQPMFKRWCRLVGREDLFDDPRYGDDDLRWQRSEELNGIMARWCADKTKAEIMTALEAAKLPAAPMLTTQEVLDDPHVQAMGFLQRVPFPGTAKDVPIIETPFRMSATPGEIRMRAPLLGEHTDEVLGEIGFAAAEIEELRTREIV